MFGRFTPTARRAVVRARREAVRAGSDRIGCEHLLLGLMLEPGPAAAGLAAAGADVTRLRALAGDGTGAQAGPLDAEALATLGIDLDAVRRAADAAFGPGALDRAGGHPRGRPVGTGALRLTGDARKAIELTLRRTVSLRHRRISSAHLLLGIIDQGDNAALTALAAAGIDTSALRADQLRRLADAA